MDTRYSVDELLKEWLLFKRRHNEYYSILRQSRMGTLSEATRISIEEIHHNVLQFEHDHKLFIDTGTVLVKGRNGQPRTSEEIISHENYWLSFL